MTKVLEEELLTGLALQRQKFVTGPDGSALSLTELPSSDTKRWTIRRKGEVVAAVSGGLLTLEEACERYKLTVDEFLSWKRGIEKGGTPALRMSEVKRFRSELREKSGESDQK